jgi:hypothetical protein
MTLRSWRPINRGALVGYASITLPLGLEIDDVAILVTEGKPWVSLPAKPVIGADGLAARVPGTNRRRFVEILRWRDCDLSIRFSAALVELVRRKYPEALGDRE